MRLERQGEAFIISLKTVTQTTTMALNNTNTHNNATSQYVNGRTKDNDQGRFIWNQLEPAFFFFEAESAGDLTERNAATCL